jgi:hypothetical protein
MHPAQQLAPAGAKVTMPSRLCTDPRFKWTCAAATDVARTWRKFRLLQRLQGALS